MRRVTGKYPQNHFSTVVSARVATLIDAHEMTQTDLALRLGHAPAWLSRRLTGFTSWTTDDVAEVARALNVPPRDIWSWDDMQEATA